LLCRWPIAIMDMTPVAVKKNKIGDLETQVRKLKKQVKASQANETRLEQTLATLRDTHSLRLREVRSPARQFAPCFLPVACRQPTSGFSPACCSSAPPLLAAENNPLLLLRRGVAAAATSGCRCCCNIGVSLLQRRGVAASGRLTCTEYLHRSMRLIMHARMQASEYFGKQISHVQKEAQLRLEANDGLVQTRERELEEARQELEKMRELVFRIQHDESLQRSESKSLRRHLSYSFEVHEG